MADLNKIYNALREKGVVTKSYEEFANAMADGNKRKNVYNALAQQGLITKSYKQFSDAVAPSHAPQTTQSTSTAPRNNDWVKQGLSVFKGVPSMPTPNIPSYRPTPLKPSEQNFDEIIANGSVYKDDNTYNSVVSGLDERIKQAQQQYQALLKQHSQNVKKGRKEASFWERLGAMPDVDDVPTKTSDDVLTPESDQLRAARETLHRLQNTRVQLERGRESKTQGEELDKRKKNGSSLLERAAYKTAISLENFGKGFMDALRGSDMWATNDAANDLMAVKNIVDKVDRWNTLTDKEKSAMTSADLLKIKPTDEELDILNNYALAYNVNAQAQDPLSSNWSYTAGGVSANSALFGIEMAASGGMNVSSSTGRAIEKGALKLSQKAVKNGLEKLVGKTFEKLLARKIAGGVGQLPVQFGMGALESTVLQNGLTERKAQEYEIGTPLMSMDDDGVLRYSESLGKLDAKSAHNRALVEQTIENQTEMLGGQIGEVLGGLTKVGVKVLNKTKLGENITKLMTDVSSNQFNRIMNNALNTAGYNGFLGEYLEEHAGDVEQALFLGTMTFDTDPETGIYNKEHILETMSGLAPMMGGHMVMEGTSYGASRARMAMMLSMAERKGSKLFGDERWAQVKQSLGGLDNQQFADKLSSMLQDKTLSDKQKKAVYNYAFYEKARQGFELMSLKQDMEGAVSLIDKNSRTNFVIGYEKGGQAAGELLTNLQKAQRNLQVRLGDYGYRQLFEENGDDFNKAYNSGMLDTDQKKQAYLDYVNALSCYQGALQRLHNDKKSELVNAKTDVDNIMDEQGNIVSATTTDGKKVNIVNGNVVLNEDGSVNVEKSGSLVVVDSDGKRKMISASEVASVDSVTKASDVLAQKNKEIVDKYATEEMSQKIQVGAQLPILTPNGSGIATIVSVNEDGSVSFKMGDSENIITTDAYNLYVMNLNAEVSSALREDDDAEQSTESAPETATEGGQLLPEEERREYAQGDEFDVIVDGQKMHAEIVSPKDADGRFVVNVDDGESMRTLYVTPEELAAMEYREEPSPKAEETRLTIEDSSDKALERGAQLTEEHAPTALERIPRDEKGNAQFHDVDTETAWDGLVEMSGNEETAHKVAEASLANAEKKLKAAKALKEKGDTQEELLQSIRENEKAVAEAEREVAAWKAIAGEKSRREEAAKAEAERKAEEERERAEKEEKARIEAEKKEAERIVAEKAEEEARVEAERKAEEERIAKQKAEEKVGSPKIDKQGNPIDAEGRLITEKVEDISDLSDDDFNNPTRSVELPKIPKNIDNALGANGKPVIIKKNIFERNKNAHSDLTAEQSREILKTALYSADLYAKNQKSKRPFNWVIIKTKDHDGKNKLVLLEVNDNKDNVEIVHWHYLDDRGLEKIKKQAEREGGQLLILPSEKEEAGALSSRTSDLPADKGSKKAEKKQEKQSVFDKAKEIADKEEKTEKNPSGNKLVTDERYEELKKRMKAKLGQLNAGVDPEMLAIGTEMAVYHIEKGARKFADYAKEMIADLGDAIRPYLKAFYNGARDLPEVEEAGLSEEMTPYDEVRSFDTANFDKENNETKENNREQSKSKPNADSVSADNPQSWVGRTFTTNTGAEFECKDVDGKYATFFNKNTFMNVGFEVATVQDYLKRGVLDMEETASERKNESVTEKAAEIDNEEELEEQHSGYSITPAQYTTKRGVVLDMHLVKFDKPLSERGYKKARMMAESSRGWYDRKDGGFMMRTAEDAEELADKIADFEGLSKEAASKESIFDKAAEIAAKDEQKRQEAETKGTEEIDRSGKVENKSYIAEEQNSGNVSESDGNAVTSQQTEDNSVKEETTQKEEDNGLQRVYAVRTEGLPSDSSGHERRLEKERGETGERAGQKSGGTDGGRGGQGTGKDGAVSAGLHGLTEPKNTRNNHSERGADHAPTSVNGRIEANIKAIELAHELLESGETATPEQMGVLRQFSGWGGLGAAFSDGGYDWKQRERNKKIRELLGEEAYEQAVMSANSAYYTPAYVVDTLWDIARQLGFKGGNILEGSAGIGNILGQMPTTVSERSDIHAIEIDGTSGGILSLLYPDAKVDIQGFEQTRIPNGSVDLAITNVPFVTGLRVNDTTGDSDLSKKFHNIHDFCIAKNVRKLREGGLGIFISSNGTLDGSKALRDWVVNEGGSDFIGAFRMNNKTFGGTTVTSDIIVIRKRVNGQKSPQAIDVSTISGERTAEYQEPGARKTKQVSMDYNKYFMEHPDHMAGEMRFAFEEGDTFRPTSKGLYPVSGKDQGKMLADFVKSFTEETGGSEAATESAKPSYVSDASVDGKKLGEMYLKDGKLVTAGFGGYYPLEVNDKKIKGHTKQECFNAYAAIKTALADVMKYQTENEDNAGLKPLIAKLNKAYDDFVNTYGHFNKNNQLAWLRNDVDYPNVFSLETYKEQGDGKGGVVKTYGKADVMKDRVVEKESEPHPENVKDGVVVSMFKNGRIDVPYIAEQLGKSEEAVKREYAGRQRVRIEAKARETAEKLHLDNVEFVTDTSGLSGRQKKAKGFFNPKTGKITIVLSNHSNEADVERTILHEAVAHYGLRQLFGERFDTFLDNVYENAENSIRGRIDEIMKEKGVSRRTATEEYLAELAERTDFTDEEAGWWYKIKRAFLRMLNSLGFNFGGVELTDNELRYILWRSYENLAEPGRYRTIFEEAKDMAKQQELKVGNYAEREAKNDSASEDGLLFRDGGTEYDFPGEDDAQKLYNAAVDGRKSRAIESWQDEMFPVKMLQEAIEKATGEKIADFENAYLLENQLGSAGNATLEKYAREVQNPMRKVYLDMLKAKFDGGSKVTKSDINKYVIAFHGLERNKYMADKNKGLPDARRDYSGFTALFGNGEQVEVEELERRAEEYIGKFEDAVGKDKADKLWSLVDESRQRTLDELVRSGLVSGDVADEWLRRFEHYVPLQGFSEEVIGEDRNANFENHITGRMSEARDPLATLVNMEYVAVTSGNHNRVKQALYNLALNHRTNLLSVMPMFSVKNPITGEWEDAVPQIDETMSPIERQQEVDKFIKQMRVRMREEKDLPESDKTVKDARKVSVGRKVLPKAVPDFIVRMKVNGRQYAVVLNGNPKAAQAINGRLKEHPNKALQKISGVTRFMSAAVTSWNPAFMLSNFARDVQAANAFAYSNEGAKYAAMMDVEIHKNLSLASLGRDLSGMKDQGIYKLYYKYRHNQLDMSNERERFFKEFIDNGGETGYTQMVDIDKIAKHMQKDEFSAIKTIKSVGKFIELANKGFENATRFAAYATSRKMGKSVMQSINDAKEISVNFNRHGNGRNGYIIAKSLYQFLNPTIQGLEKQLRTIKEHPLKGTAVLIATPIAIGFAIPLVNIGLAMLSGGGDDDKKYYWSLSDWTRRNNLIIGVAGKFIKIPLPPELRVFYGIGEMLASKMSNPYDKTNLLTEIPKHISETLPFNDTNSTFPSFVKPFIESEITDKDFMGRKITGRSDYNTQDPEWKQAGYNTDDEYIAAAKWWHSLFADNDNERGSWFAEINPSVAEHLIKGYTGGMGSIVGQVYTTVKAIAKGNEKDYSDSRNWPIVNRVYVQTTKEDAVKKTTNTAYRFYQDNYKNYGHTFKETLKDEKSDIFQKAQRISNMVETSEYKRYRMTEPFIKADKLLWDEIKALKETDDKESLEWIEKEQTRLRSVLVDASEKFDNYDNAGLTDKLDRMSKPGAYKSDLKIDVKSAPNKDMRKFAKEYNVKVGKYKQQAYKDEQGIKKHIRVNK